MLAPDAFPLLVTPVNILIKHAFPLLPSPYPCISVFVLFVLFPLLSCRCHYFMLRSSGILVASCS